MCFRQTASYLYNRNVHGDGLSRFAVVDAVPKVSKIQGTVTHTDTKQIVGQQHPTTGGRKNRNVEIHQELVHGRGETTVIRVVDKVINECRLKLQTMTDKITNTM